MSRVKGQPGEQHLPEVFAASERDMAEAWLKITLDNFRRNIKQLKIGSSGELLASLSGALLSAAGGDELRVRIAYAVQGMYVDMGVGRGMGAGITKDAGGTDYRRLRNGKGQLNRYERKAKRWYARQMSRESKRLAELASELWGQAMVSSVATALPPVPVEINL